MLLFLKIDFVDNMVIFLLVVLFFSSLYLSILNKKLQNKIDDLKEENKRKYEKNVFYDDVMQLKDITDKLCDEKIDTNLDMDSVKNDANNDFLEIVDIKKDNDNMVENNVLEKVSVIDDDNININEIVLILTEKLHIINHIGDMTSPAINVENINNVLILLPYSLMLLIINLSI